MSTEVRKSIRKILFENHNNIWNDFNSDEMMGDAEMAAMQDMESSGENFEPIGKSEYDKNLDIDALIDDLETQKHIKSAALERIQKQIDQLKRFGGGSLNEENPNVNQDSKIDRPKDSEGQPITLRARVEDLKTGSIGRVIRFGVDDSNQLTIHVSWLTKYGEVAPKSIVYPKDIIVKDDSRVVKETELTDEGVGLGLTIKKGMNAKPTHGK